MSPWPDDTPSAAAPRAGTVTEPDGRAYPTMDKRQRRRLRDMLADLDSGERDRLTKRAAKLRQAALRTMTGDARRP